jgi:hypothetical protein
VGEGAAEKTAAAICAGRCRSYRQDNDELKNGIMGFIVWELIFAAIGWICLSIWYRDRKKMEKIKEEKYAGLYSGAGRVFVLNFIAGVGAITLSGVVIAALVKWIYDAIAN